MFPGTLLHTYSGPKKEICIRIFNVYIEKITIFENRKIFSSLPKFRDHRCMPPFPDPSYLFKTSDYIDEFSLT